MALPAARRIGAQAALKANNVFRTLQKVNTPAGEGVEMTTLVEALPYFGLNQLVDCASHFGQRGRVIGPVAAEIAAEIGRRLRRSVDAGVSMSQNLNAKEVTTAFYAFSKLSPQMPEYRVFYDAVADGLIERRWQLEGMKAALVGTALADTETRLSDALPAVLQPVLQNLSESEKAREEISVDELRFLVHAAVRLPTLLSEKEIEALAECTERLVASSAFSVQAHLAVSWLRLTPPPNAKGVHLNALELCCKMLASHSKSHYPAHPLPPQGLSPAVEALLAREAEQNAPPLTPPVLQNITKGLVQISWGLQRYQWNHDPSRRSLGIDDWTEIIETLMAFCEAHVASKDSGSTRVPLWAREALYHVLWRAQHRRRAKSYDENLADMARLKSIRSLLSLLKRYKPSPPADPQFFQWAERVVRAHQKAGDAVELVTVISELVPFLPDHQRSTLARLVMTEPKADTSATWSSATSSSSESARAASSATARSESSESARRMFLDGASSLKAPVVLSSRPEMMQTGSAQRSHGRLWGMLASPEAAPSESLRVKEPASQIPVESSLKAEAEERQRIQATAEFREETVEERSSTPHAAVEELQEMLRSALQRVEALESRIQDQERQAANKQNEPFDDACNKSLGAESGNWLTNILTAPAEQIQSSAATLHLRRSFIFEEFRKAQSARLQSERLRVAVPPDHFPLWPITMKK
ncbi:unnamed protein product [Cladocopium goreaui]|uniref:Uncharacterized protein n=1 Tax=Cladocopium goreaui TaxID=2562237 RepID=A0A9P1GPT6_9DINO|nr:unnamed protein product [Cladocopium goreaui]|mmetsp:Transcript_49342/g.107454  ORF Transcript_49342/g.107454 Transcript_49342/m.107454 type:complete len:703 (+) Transcript_49342:143-2251(+)